MKDDVLDAIRVAPLSTDAIATRLGVNPNAVRDLIGPLLKAGVVRVHSYIWRQRDSSSAAAQDKIPLFWSP